MQQSHAMQHQHAQSNTSHKTHQGPGYVHACVVHAWKLVGRFSTLCHAMLRSHLRWQAEPFAVVWRIQRQEKAALLGSMCRGSRHAIAIPSFSMPGEAHLRPSTVRETHRLVLLLCFQARYYPEFTAVLRKQTKLSPVWPVTAACMSSCYLCHRVVHTNTEHLAPQQTGRNLLF